MDESIKVYKSTEVPDDVWEGIAEGYNECFGGNRTGESCKRGFTKGFKGYCLHGVKFNEEGKVVGHNYFQPIPYNFNGKEIILALSGGTFVVPSARKDAFIFYDLINILKKESKSLGWEGLLGVPNENSFQYSVKIIRDKHIADLNYYILPVNPGKIIKKNIPLTKTIGRLYANSALAFNSIVSALFNSKEKNKPLRLTPKYRKHRLKDYKGFEDGKYYGKYRMYDEDGIMTAYIMDFREGEKKSAKALNKLVKFILKNEKNVDAIIYPGTMNLKQALLTKVPHKFVPHQLHLCSSVFDKDNKELADAVSSIDNMDFGLVNFDVR